MIREILTPSLKAFAQKPEINFKNGEPPFAGWWLTKMDWERYYGESQEELLKVDPTLVAYLGWRWWNGKHWSDSASESDTAWIAGYVAKRAASTGHGPLSNTCVLWSDWYPHDALVPRVNPHLR
jgi:hypothetical protein